MNYVGTDSMSLKNGSEMSADKTYGRVARMNCILVLFDNGLTLMANKGDLMKLDVTKMVKLTYLSTVTFE